jgi:hypothetical protein
VSIGATEIMGEMQSTWVTCKRKEFAMSISDFNDSKDDWISVGISTGVEIGAALGITVELIRAGIAIKV